MTKIAIQPVASSRISSVDFDNLPFGRTFSDHMFTADYKDGEWGNYQIVPFGPFEVHPACMALHYGQAIFEGMKASKSKDDQPMLFRPELHAQRLNASARRLSMPEFPETVFVDAVEKLVGLEHEWIPPGPVGPYYSKPVRLIAEDQYVRAAIGGVGEAKAAGNYAASLLPAAKAKAGGYDQVMWMDAKEFKYIQEAGTMNLFFVIDGKIVTPVSEITYKDLTMVLPPMEERKIGKMLKATIDGLRAGTIEDSNGWVRPIEKIERVAT